MSIAYSKEHIWVKEEDGVALLGLSEYAVTKLKAIMFLDLPEEGDEVDTDSKFGDVESKKTVSDMISPVTGVVTEVNEEALDDPDLISDDPKECWLVKVKISHISDSLMDEDEYEEYTKTL